MLSSSQEGCHVKSLSRILGSKIPITSLGLVYVPTFIISTIHVGKYTVRRPKDAMDEAFFHLNGPSSSDCNKVNFGSHQPEAPEKSLQCGSNHL